MLRPEFGELHYRLCRISTDDRPAASHGGCDIEFHYRAVQRQGHHQRVDPQRRRVAPAAGMNFKIGPLTSARRRSRRMVPTTPVRSPLPNSCSRPDHIRSRLQFMGADADYALSYLPAAAVINNHRRRCPQHLYRAGLRQYTFSDQLHCHHSLQLHDPGYYRGRPIRCGHSDESGIGRSGI